MPQQKRYPKEFKDEACRLVIEQGYTQRQAAEQLGVNPLTLKDWLSSGGRPRSPTRRSPTATTPTCSRRRSASCSAACGASRPRRTF
jgi:transposase-like protein